MKKIHRILLLIALTGFYTQAQVKDISFTLSPAAEYTLWDDKAGLDDGLLIGGKLGFGFGEYLELRGIYLQSLDLKTNFEDFGLANYSSDVFTSQDVKLTRWGGEFKGNIGTKKLNPYLTLGTGVQTLELDGDNKFEQIYGSVGLGIKVNLTPRAVFSLEAKNTTYNFNSGRSLLTDENKAAFAVTDADFQRDRLYNWSLQGSLQFYLGGRRPGTLTSLDQAYLDKFKGGFRGLQLVLEPSLGYIAFDENSLFRDTYLLGGYAGFDFNEYIGLRGFYFQSTKDEKISTDFDELAMYGMELRARLNDGNGVTPFLILGGGYLNAYQNYLGKEDVNVVSGEFAAGGLGLNIPLGKRLLISGGVRAMLTAGSDLTDVTNTDDLQTHIMYNLGLKLSLGRKSVSPEKIYNENLNRELDAQTARNNEKLFQLKLEYQEKVVGLEEELKLAYESKDVNKAVEILEEKKEVKKALAEVEKLEEVQKAKKVEKSTPKVNVTTPVQAVEKSELIQMTPSEFESLIDRILKGLEETPENKTPTIQQAPSTPKTQQQIEYLNKRIDLLEKLLLEANSKNVYGDSNSLKEMQMRTEQDKTVDMSQRILEELSDLNRKIDRNTDRIDANSNKAQTVVVTPISSNKEELADTNLNEERDVIEDQTISDNETMLTYKNASGILGFNYGGATTANLGIRLHFDINKAPLEFMPEVYVGFGEGTSYGVSGNVIYPFKMIKEKVKPYGGLGLGFGSVADDFKGFYNVILGAELPFIHKNVYVDYTMRNSFNYNQIAIGYRFPF